LVVAVLAPSLPARTPLRRAVLIVLAQRADILPAPLEVLWLDVVTVQVDHVVPTQVAPARLATKRHQAVCMIA